MSRSISIKLKAINFLEKNKDACSHSFKFDPVDLYDVDELSDVFELSDKDIDDNDKVLGSDSDASSCNADTK